MQKKSCSESQDPEVRKGPWTMEEDLILINYIANHGEGVWNSLAKAAGLKRTGKSCRLRWLNYLRPDVRRGNITLEEQLLIMELHAKWGNRWSKIAKHLPGRTDNEIKNYWRTRIQKHIKQADHNNIHQAQSSNNSCSSNSHHLMNIMNINQQPTACHVSAASAMTMESYSPTSYNNNHHQPAGNMEIFPGILPPGAETTENYWGMEDLWSMQLLNND